MSEKTIWIPENFPAAAMIAALAFATNDEEADIRHAAGMTQVVRMDDGSFRTRNWDLQGKEVANV